MKFKQLLVSLLVIAPLSVQAFEKAERWFDIEVILFSQLAGKSHLNENFDKPKPLPNYKKIHDLLTPYIQPSITNLKKLLPICGIQESGAKKTPIQFNLNTEILSVPLLSGDITSNIIEDSDISVLLTNAEKEFSISNEENISLDNIDVANIDVNNFDITNINIAENPPFFSINKQLCRLSPEVLKQLTAVDSSFEPDALVINKVPKQINAIEDLYNNEPYLLSQESLTLHDIYQKIKSSRQFKPLLHIGWRQPAVSKRKAIPMHLFAGDNFKEQYQISLKQFLNEQKIEAEQENTLQNIFADEESSFQAGSKTTQDKLAQKTKLLEIIRQLKKHDSDSNEQYQALVPLDILLEEDNNEEYLAPLPPTQNWSIDGFFNVHLNHYLYITADFLIADKSLSTLNSQRLISDKNTNIKSIRFEQNRRVISQEIHYFDHPHMGMIVQIRRHKRPEADIKD